MRYLSSWFDPESLKDIIAIYIAVLLVGALFGMTMPLMALELEHMGASKLINGLSASVGVSTMLLMAPMTPWLLHKFGTRNLMGMGCIMGSVTLLLFPIFPDVWAWFPLRFLFGLCLSALFTCSETWLNLTTPKEIRGVMLGIYGTMLSLGFALGPWLLTTVGASGWPAFAVAALLTFAAGSVILFLARNRMVEKTPQHVRISMLVRNNPTPFLAAFVFGGIETGIFNLLPIHGLLMDMQPQQAALLLVWVGVGNLLLQLPIGWLADRMNQRLLLGICALIGAIGGWGLAMMNMTELPAKILLLVWGGAVVGFYTVGLSMLVKRGTETQIPSMNAGFLMMYGLGAVSLPSVTGELMDRLDVWGLPFAIIVLCGGYFVLLVIRAQRPS